MKMLIVGLMAISALNVFALPVKNCPHSLSVTVSDIQVTKTPAVTFAEAIDDGAGESDQVLEVIEQAFHNISLSNEYTKAYQVRSAENGRCTYDGSVKQERAELYTKSGKVMLMTQIHIAARGVLLRSYTQVGEVTPTSVDTTGARTGLALAIPRGHFESYSYGGPLVFVGNAGAIAVQAL